MIQYIVGESARSSLPASLETTGVASAWCSSSAYQGEAISMRVFVRMELFTIYTLNRSIDLFYGLHNIRSVQWLFIILFTQAWVVLDLQTCPRLHVTCNSPVGWREPHSSTRFGPKIAYVVSPKSGQNQNPEKLSLRDLTRGPWVPWNLWTWAL